ncbi:unnamed protein product [Triticum turgidum subsp. durum]|uniref:Mitochondrial import inner membrane translocase subunit TIM50 n=2 Tax=Triticum TaxID=4564 RepID=A0A9R0VPI7_TRITD|nr:unnamed protein product [Triticum turgidum subsp. durum]
MSRIARSRFALTLRSSAAPFSTISPAAAAAASLASKEAPAGADASSAPKEAAAAGDPSPAPPSGTRSSFRLLKAGIFTAVTAALGATGYVTYAYSVDEVDQMTREFRKNSKLPISEDLSCFEKFKAMAYSETVKVPAAAIDLYLDVRSQIEDQIQGFVEPSSEKLLPDLPPQEQHVFTIVLDLNETLVYSDWKRERGWRTFKRPGVDAFLEHLAKFYEVVVYSDQLSMYVDPVMERLDAKGCVRHRLSRVATKYVNGKHYRPENCLPIKPWKLEAEDTQLIDLIPLLEFVATARVSDIRPVLASFEGRDIAAEFLERSRRVYEQKEQKQQHGRIWRR